MINQHKYILIGGGVAALGLLYLVNKPGAAKNIGFSVGEAAVDVVDGTVTGVVTGISNGIGLPTPAETITDPQECKRYLDANGYWAASAHCSLPAFAQAITM